MEGIHLVDRHEHDRERGVALVLSALLLVALLAVAALVIDVGGVYNQRRQDQSGADAGALAGAFQLGDRAAAVTQAKDKVHDTLGVVFTSSQWNSCGDADDPALPSGYSAFGGSNCIAFSGSSRRILVRIPERSYATSFGRVIGMDSIVHSAFAIAGLTPLGFGGVLPFGLVGTTSSFMCADSGGGNTGFCKSAGSGVTPGNFGVADFALWGDDIAGTTTNCSTTGQAPTNRIPNNVAVGVDHDLEIHPNAPTGGASGRKLDTGGGSFTCPGSEPSNAAKTITGENLGDEVGSGLWSGANFSDGGDARLQRLGTLPNTPAWMLTSGRERSVDGHDLDNIPLWEFIPSGSALATSSVPRSCWRDQFTGPDNVFGNSDDRQNLPVAVSAAIPNSTSNSDRVVILMDRCFVHYGEDTDNNGTSTSVNWPGTPSLGVVMTTPEPPCDDYVSNGGSPTNYSSCAVANRVAGFSDPVFSRNTNEESPLDLFDIQYTPRFAFVPKTTEPNGNEPRDFTSFFTIYIQRVLAGCSAGQGCNLDFDPGIGTTAITVNSSVQGKIDAMGVFVFPHSEILPNSLAHDDAAFRDNANRTRSLVR